MKFLRDDRGSAAVEFSVLAVPLFIPIFLFLGQFASISGNEEIMRVMVRESVRVYVASSSESAGRTVAHNVINILGIKLGLNGKEMASVTLQFECSNNPCLSAKGRIRATIRMRDGQTGRAISASAQQYVNPWS